MLVHALADRRCRVRCGAVSPGKKESCTFHCKEALTDAGEEEREEGGGGREKKERTWTLGFNGHSNPCLVFSATIKLILFVTPLHMMTQTPYNQRKMVDRTQTGVVIRSCQCHNAPFSRPLLWRLAGSEPFQQNMIQAQMFSQSEHNVHCLCTQLDYTHCYTQTYSHQQLLVQKGERRRDKGSGKKEETDRVFLYKCRKEVDINPQTKF